MTKLIRVCKICSKVNIDNLIEKVGECNVKVGCVSACRKEKGNYFGKINGVYVSEENEKEFLEKCE